MIVIGMGKPGAHELNFSSDIDLIFAFRSAGKTTGGRRAISHQEYFDKLGQRFIALLDERTADGFVFRVDMRLRPFGDSGPLSSSFDALEHYYQLHGRDWERYAWIKARIITGAARDGEALARIVTPFVYRRYLDYGALAALREMKALISAEAAHHDLKDDVKLGVGGIREIEFIGQTFQLIRGGRDPQLRHRSILVVLEVCAKLKLFDTDDGQALAAAYRFLRKSEHRLQQVADRQTHQLPTSELEQMRLAFGLGYASYATFMTELARHREVVCGCFDKLLTPPEPAAVRPPRDLSSAAALWREKADVTNRLAALGFDDPSAARAVIEQLKRPRFLGALSHEGRERLNRLMPHLITATAKHTRSAATLARLGGLIRAVARRSVYLSLLAENPSALQRLIDLYHASPWIARAITQQPVLLDELLDPRVLFTPSGRDQLITHLNQLLGAYDPNDAERLMDTLRDFKNQQVLRVAAGDIMHRFPVAEVSDQLSDIAAALLHHALHAAARILLDKHGEPRRSNAADSPRIGFAIIAYGKLGGFELGYGSDLDLVFIHDNDSDPQMTDGTWPIDNNVYFTRLTKRVIHFLTTRTAAGRAYEIDTRLRPSGQSGLLVSTLTAFTEYQKSSALTWEHQALIRARAIAGTPETMAAFERLRRETLMRPRDAAQLRREIVAMRERLRAEHDRSDSTTFDLKYGVGGITDIEFMVQYGVLRWAPEHHDLLAFTDKLRLLDGFTRLGLMATAVGTVLHNAYFTYRAEVHRCALQETATLVEDTQFRHHRKVVENAWREMFGPQ